MNLQMVFALPNGAYLADVDVEIADRSGDEVLNVDSSEPLLLAQLPPGSYRVTASAGGERIERSVDVPAQGRHVEYFHWRRPAERTTSR